MSKYYSHIAENLSFSVDEALVADLVSHSLRFMRRIEGVSICRLRRIQLSSRESKRSWLMPRLVLSPLMHKFGSSDCTFHVSYCVQENLGATEVRDFELMKAEFLSRIGDKVKWLILGFLSRTAVISVCVDRALIHQFSGCCTGCIRRNSQGLHITRYKTGRSVRQNKM